MTKKQVKKVDSEPEEVKEPIEQVEIEEVEAPHTSVPNSAFSRNRVFVHIEIFLVP